MKMHAFTELVWPQMADVAVVVLRNRGRGVVKARATCKRIDQKSSQTTRCIAKSALSLL